MAAASVAKRPIHRNDISPEVVRSLLDYQPETGALIWKERAGGPPNWNARFAGKVAGHLAIEGYRVIAISGRRYFAHRLVWVIVHGRWPKHHLDHVNRERDDNRLPNLREATNSQNQANGSLRGRVSFTGHRGISWSGPNRWTASIVCDGKTRRLGTFGTLEAAVNAYREAAVDLFGEFAAVDRE